MENQLIENEYKSRINKACDYIENNIDKQLTLEEIACAANFSKFHFHRIFLAIIGETPFHFLLRIRLERAAFMITTNPAETITEIALRCGFTDISVFSRNFKGYFKKSATEFRKERNEKSNLSQVDSKTQQVADQPFLYICPGSNKIKWRTNMKLSKGVEVKVLPAMTAAYVRHIGPYKGDEKLFKKLWDKLFTWAGPRGLICWPGFKMLVIYHDDLNVTNEDKLRMSVCITVPPETKVDGEVGKLTIESANYAVARFVVTSEEFEQAWKWVYGEWFPTSGYQPDDKPCFEMYPEEPKDGKFTVDICVPVKPL